MPPRLKPMRTIQKGLKTSFIYTQKEDVDPFMERMMDIIGEEGGGGNAAVQAKPAKVFAEEEMKLYEKEPMLPLVNREKEYNNPLDWWRKNQYKFPLLAILAEDYLSIQATSAASYCRGCGNGNGNGNKGGKPNLARSVCTSPCRLSIFVFSSVRLCPDRST